jgi:hypothetical protein
MLGGHMIFSDACLELTDMRRAPVRRVMALALWSGVHNGPSNGVSGDQNICPSNSIPKLVVLS